MQAKIWVWIVSYRTSVICFSEKEANDVNLMSHGGWGTIKKEKRLAELVENKKKK